MSSLTELFEFLHSPNPDARQVALTNLLGHTAKSSANRSIFIPKGASIGGGGGLQSAAAAAAGSKGGVKTSSEDEVKLEMLEDLKMLCRDQAMIAHDAFSALVNLSDTLMVARHLVDQGFLTFLMSYIANTTSPLSPLAAMLLSNISSHPTLTPIIPSLPLPLITFPTETTTKGYPSYYYPASRSASSTVHPDFRNEMLEGSRGQSVADVDVDVDGTLNTDGPKGKGKGRLEQIEAVRALVQAFEDGASEGVEEGKKEGKRRGGVHFLASVFANISMLPQTRHTLLIPYPTFPLPAIPESQKESDEPLLTKIVCYTEHPDTIRRGGALGCIKNAAMDRASHPFLLATEDERVTLPESKDSSSGRKVKGVDVLPWVLSPLMGPEEVDMDEMDALPVSLQFLGEGKLRERDGVLRLMCVEILLLLATSFTGRECLRKRGCYTVIKLAHDAETDEKISEHMIRLVGLLKRDESGESGLDHLKPTEFGQEEVGLPGKAGADADGGDSDLEIEVI